MYYIFKYSIMPLKRKAIGQSTCRSRQNKVLRALDIDEQKEARLVTNWVCITQAHFRWNNRGKESKIRNRSSIHRLKSWYLSFFSETSIHQRPTVLGFQWKRWIILLKQLFEMENLNEIHCCHTWNSNQNPNDFGSYAIRISNDCSIRRDLPL